MTETIYTYQTKKGVNVETFSSNGYVTLTQNGLFMYEHHFGGAMLNLQQQLLENELETRKIKYTKIVK